MSCRQYRGVRLQPPAFLGFIGPFARRACGCRGRILILQSGPGGERHDPLLRIQYLLRISQCGADRLAALSGPALHTSMSLAGGHLTIRRSIRACGSSAGKPRALSLLPRVHMAVIRPEMLCADLHRVFAKAKDSRCPMFSAGPRRTADIELTVEPGVHGPQELYVWMMGKSAKKPSPNLCWERGSGEGGEGAGGRSPRILERHLLLPFHRILAAVADVERVR